MSQLPSDHSSYAIGWLSILGSFSRVPGGGPECSGPHQARAEELGFEVVAFFVVLADIQAVGFLLSGDA